MSELRPDDLRTAGARAADQTTRTQRGDLPGEVELMPEDERGAMRARWERVQTSFVDEPRRAVQDAHELVSDLVGSLTRAFASQRDKLEGTWASGGDVSTEDLRRALQRYRSLFNQLLGPSA